eukprot:403353269
MSLKTLLCQVSYEPIIKKEFEELKERLELLQKSKTRKSIAKVIGTGILASGIFIGVAIMLAKKKNN